MALTKFDICSNALIMIGAKPITDFSGSIQESVVANQLYDTEIKNQLSLYEWRFASRQVQLSRLAAVPDDIWSAAYSEPSDMITLKQITIEDKGIVFDRYEDNIYCNAAATDVLIAHYVYYVSEANWPPYFVALVEYALAKKFAFPLGAKLDLKEEYTNDWMLQFRLAKFIDSKQQTTKKLKLTGRRSIMEARLG